MPAKKPEIPSRPPRERPLVAPGRAKRSDRVLIAFEAPEFQRRSTVLFRFVLVFPHLLWSVLLGIATAVVLVIAWFGALFTGRVSGGIADFLAHVVQYQTRVTAYGPLLLTDHFPRYSLYDQDHSIAVETAPGPLNRAAVLFRPVLMAPSLAVAFVAFVGAQIVGVVGWFITLMLGRMPAPLFQANASLLRYLARTHAFAFMLTAEQPSKLFRGDPVPSRPKGGLDTPESDVPEVPVWPPVMRLTLSAGAKRLLGAFIVLGALGAAGVTAGTVALAERDGDATNYQEVLRHAHDELAAALSRFNSEVRACNGEAQLVCLHQADERFANAFDAFETSAVAADASPSSDAERLLANARSCATALRARARSIDPAAYDAALSQVRAALVAFDRSYADLAA